MEISLHVKKRKEEKKGTKQNDFNTYANILAIISPYSNLNILPN